MHVYELTTWKVYVNHMQKKLQKSFIKSSYAVAKCAKQCYKRAMSKQELNWTAYYQFEKKVLKDKTLFRFKPDDVLKLHPRLCTNKRPFQQCVSNIFPSNVVSKPTLF